MHSDLCGLQFLLVLCEKVALPIKTHPNGSLACAYFCIFVFMLSDSESAMK